jgi:hypothetical protein
MTPQFTAAGFTTATLADDDLIVLHAERSAIIMDREAGNNCIEADRQAAKQLGFENLEALQTACLTAWRSRFATAKPRAEKAELLADYAMKFLNSTWARDALALGWCARDLFGVDPEHPIVRLDRQGLLPGIAFSSFKLKLGLLTADCTVLVAPTGSHLRHSRMIGDACRVPAWQCGVLFLA